MAFKRRILAVIVGAFAASPWGLADAATVPPGGRLHFTVIRNGETIGHNTLDFSQSADRLEVRVRTAVAVKIAFITAYHFNHEATETWQNGRLWSLASRTDDDGVKHELRVQAENGALQVDGDRKRSEAPAAIVPASLWNRDIVASRMLLNTLDGSQMAIQVEDAGMEQVRVAGATVAARHYRLTGDLQRELWYDESGALVQVRLRAKDGSDVLYAIR